MFQGRTRNFYVQFLTSIAEATVGLVHEQVYVACTWLDRVGTSLIYKVEPKNSMPAVDTCLSATRTDFTRHHRRADDRQHIPKVGIVLQEVWNFAAPLSDAVLNHDPEALSTRVIKITRKTVRSKKSDKKWPWFHLTDEGAAVDVSIPAEAQIALELISETLADEERIRRYIVPLRAEHCVWRAIHEFAENRVRRRHNTLRDGLGERAVCYLIGGSGPYRPGERDSERDELTGET